MGIPLIQMYRVGTYILGKRLRGQRRYPLVLMLEPLYQCNLACAGCGKIDHPDHILRQRMDVDEALRAVDEADAPVVSIPGGEPLLHKQLPELVEGIIARRKFVYLCTNAMLMKKKLDQYKPSPYFTWSVHLDGLRERHDESVCQEGVFDRAVAAIGAARERGFRVSVNCTLFEGEDPKQVADFFDYCTYELGVEGITASPGYSYEHAPRQDVFLPRSKSKELFRQIFRYGRERGSKWPLSHSALYLDFVAGNQSYECSPWSNVTYNIFGWQRPCYLMDDGGYADSFHQLMEETNWENYGTGRNPKCDNCMAHCGYEGTAVDDTFTHPWKAFKAWLRGPRLEGEMAPELPIRYDPEQFKQEAPGAIHIPVESIGRRKRSDRQASETAAADD